MRALVLRFQADEHPFVVLETGNASALDDRRAAVTAE
jgi:hypothetical protein